MDLESRRTLTEPGVKYFLRETLKQCHNKRSNYYNIIWNCGFFLLLIVLVGVILSYRKRHKLTPEEKKKKNEKDHAQVMTKIKALREERKRINNEIITNLPKFESDYEVLHKKFYAV